MLVKSKFTDVHRLHVLNVDLLNRNLPMFTDYLYWMFDWLNWKLPMYMYWNLAG